MWDPEACSQPYLHNNKLPHTNLWPVIYLSKKKRKEITCDTPLPRTLEVKPSSHCRVAVPLWCIVNIRGRADLVVGTLLAGQAEACQLATRAQESLDQLLHNNKKKCQREPQPVAAVCPNTANCCVCLFVQRIIFGAFLWRVSLIFGAQFCFLTLHVHTLMRRPPMCVKRRHSRRNN